MAKKGDDVTLNCKGSGSPKPIVKWSRVGKSMPDGSSEIESDMVTFSDVLPMGMVKKLLSKLKLLLNTHLKWKLLKCLSKLKQAMRLKLYVEYMRFQNQQLSGPRMVKYCHQATE